MNFPSDEKVYRPPTEANHDLEELNEINLKYDGSKEKRKLGREGYRDNNMKESMSRIDMMNNALKKMEKDLEELEMETKKD